MCDSTLCVPYVCQTTMTQTWSSAKRVKDGTTTLAWASKQREINYESVVILHKAATGHPE